MIIYFYFLQILYIYTCNKIILTPITSSMRKLNYLALILSFFFISVSPTFEIPQMAMVEGGTFKMGDEFGIGYEDELPVHNVTVNSFFLSKTEITVKQFKSYCRETGADLPEAPEWGWKDDQPIVNLTWNEAKYYCEWLSSKIGKVVRLPYEAEWEFAAKGGINNNGYLYSGSNEIDTVAWYEENSKNSVHAVAKKEANILGLHDMSGNVWEWCMDKYGEDYYQSSANKNPKGQLDGEWRVLRGGDCINANRYCRTSYRTSDTPSIRYEYYGFRVCYPLED